MKTVRLRRGGKAAGATGPAIKTVRDVPLGDTWMGRFGRPGRERRTAMWADRLSHVLRSATSVQARATSLMLMRYQKARPAHAMSWRMQYDDCLKARTKQRDTRATNSALMGVEAI